MADYNVLKSSVAAVIKTNNRREITGQLLQNVLTQMINVIGENYQLAGFADPTTNPQSPDQNVFYVAEQSGVYPYFDNIIVPEGVTFLMWKNSQWTAHTIGVVTTEYLSENYVTKEFFRSMFRAYDSNGVEIEPNNDGDEPYTIDNIKAMVGFWTNEYISALGQGSGGGGGGGSNSLAGLTDDVAINPQTLAGGQALIYNGTTHKWENGSAVINMASVWSALGASTNEQINASHLSAALQGFATQEWVGQNYVSIGFFSRLFQAHGTENNQQTDIDPNDTDSTITSIEAMFGFWTEQYLSALGNSGGGSVSLTLSNMGDVSLNNLADGQALTYNATTGKWVNANPQGGVTDLASLTDVTLTTPSANQVLLYDGTTSKWINSGLKTINGESIYGTGNIVIGGGGSGYLPLTGGTMTGDIKFNRATYAYNSGGVIWGNTAFIGCDNSNGLGIYATKIYLRPNSSKGSSSGLGVVIDSSNITYNGYTIWHEGNFAPSNYLPLTGGTLTGRLTINSGVLNITGGTTYAEGIRIHDVGGISSIWFRCSRATGYDAGMWGITANSNGMRFRGAASPSATSPTDYINIIHGGNVGIGTTSPNYKLHVNGTLGAGNTSVANLESEGYVSALSDIRKKEVVEYMDGLTIEQIASMPIIKFTWRDRPEEGLQVGSVAQEWQKILPQSVHTTHDGFLSFADGRAALVGTISNSRKLVEHEKRIAELERENKELKLKLNIA